MWKNIVERGRPQMTIWRMRIACWMPRAANTQGVYYCFSTAKVVARTRLSVTLHVHCLSCLNFCKVMPDDGSLNQNM
jgi:hypothetical protein